ncbi:MAG: Hsp20/alpha crystallin family protein [Sulfurimonas sp.]|nr:Hsp20/alpha crystallin family protein [Sulfurimonas sp.]
MFITRYNPSINMKEYRRGLDLFNSLLDDYVTVGKQSDFGTGFTPAINTREGEFAYHVEVDLPGINKENINISVEDNKLVISGERKTKEEIKEENYYKIESSFGSFSRSFSLPEGVDIENIRAESQDGVLEIVVPKLKKDVIDKVKKITIK